MKIYSVNISFDLIDANGTTTGMQKTHCEQILKMVEQMFESKMTNYDIAATTPMVSVEEKKP